MEKVCRGCGRVYYRQFRRNSGREGWCGGRCYMRTYRRSLGEAAKWQPAGAARAGRDEPPGPLVCHQDTLEGRETVTESGDIIGFNLDLVAERPLVAQTRFAEDGSIGVDWRGRCWAWLNGDEAPALAEVVVNDAETARLLVPGQVRRVRAMVRAVETAAGRVAGLEVLTDQGAARGRQGTDRRRYGSTTAQWQGGHVPQVYQRHRRGGRQAVRRGSKGPGTRKRRERAGGGRRGSGLTANATGNGCPSTQRGPGGFEPPGPPVFSGPIPLLAAHRLPHRGPPLRLGWEAPLVYRWVCTTPEDANAALRQPGTGRTRGVEIKAA